MSNMSVQNNSGTLFQQVVDSKPGQFVQDNKALSASAAVATGVVLHQAADKSEIAATLIKKGAVPVIGLGTAAAGAALVHDAFASDAERGKGETLLRGAAGAAMALGGVEVAGQAYGVSPLTAGAKAVANVVPKDLLIGAALMTPGLVATSWGVSDMKENGVTLGNAAAVGLGSTQAAFYGTALATENAAPLVQKAGEKFVGVVAAGGLGLGAYALGEKAVANLSDENYTKAGLYGAGAAALGLGSAHVAAKTLGLPGLEKAVQVAAKNPLLTGSAIVLGVTAGAYAMYSAKGDE